MKYSLTTSGSISAIDVTISSSKCSPVTSSSAPIETPPRALFPTLPFTHTSIKLTKINYHCCHRILSTLADNLYDIYYERKSAKELWDVLKEEYDLDDIEIK